MKNERVRGDGLRVYFFVSRRLVFGKKKTRGEGLKNEERLNHPGGHSEMATGTSHSNGFLEKRIAAMKPSDCATMDVL